MANKNSYSWKAPEFPYYPKSPLWYAGFAIAGLLILIYAIWQRDILMALTLLTLFSVVSLYAGKKPKTITVNLSEKGISLGKNLYLYNDIKSFWIIYQPPQVKTLNFETTSYLNHDIVVQLEDQDPNEIRDFLVEILPEDTEREESYSDKVLRGIRF